MGRASRCVKCGRVCGRYSRTCLRCDKHRLAELKNEAISVVATGKCPECGQKLVRELAIAGWWKCPCYGARNFRKAEHQGLPDCSFQCFTE